MRKKIILSTLALLLCVSGCSENTIEKDTVTDSLWVMNTEEESPVDEETKPIMSNEEHIGDRMITRTLTQELKVPGENFSLLVSYDTGDYDIDSWNITEDKDIGIKVQTKNLPESTECLIDHVHYEISLKSMDPELNGIKQDEMDDTFHGVGQDGFYINNHEMYYNIFAIEGFSENLIRGYSNSYYGRISERRITEDDLRKHDTYAEKVVVVFDLNIKNPGDERYHTVSVSSKFLVPLSDYLSRDDYVTIIHHDENGAQDFVCRASNIALYDDGTADVVYSWYTYTVNVDTPLYSARNDHGIIKWYMDVSGNKELERALNKK